uniref:Sushi domain-containing protein n=1 Tax=Macrostomum lignano TaxID=282301 RepID=A0A1I8IY44_9PLAT
ASACRGSQASWLLSAGLDLSDNPQLAEFPEFSLPGRHYRLGCRPGLRFSGCGSESAAVTLNCSSGWWLDSPGLSGCGGFPGRWDLAARPACRLQQNRFKTGSAYQLSHAIGHLARCSMLIRPKQLRQQQRCPHGSRRTCSGWAKQIRHSRPAGILTSSAVSKPGNWAGRLKTAHFAARSLACCGSCSSLEASQPLSLCGLLTELQQLGSPRTGEQGPDELVLSGLLQHRAHDELQQDVRPLVQLQAEMLALRRPQGVWQPGVGVAGPVADTAAATEASGFALAVGKSIEAAVSQLTWLNVLRVPQLPIFMLPEASVCRARNNLQIEQRSSRPEVSFATISAASCFER